jgi:hypothetical protein
MSATSPKPEGQVRLPDSPTTVTHPHLSQALGCLAEANKAIPIRERYERGLSHSHVARKAFEEPVLRHFGSTNRMNSSDSIHPYLRMRLTTASAPPEVSANVPAMRVPDVGDPAVLETPLLDLFGAPSSLGQQTLLVGRDTSPPRMARRRIRFRGAGTMSGVVQTRTLGKEPFIGPSVHPPYGPRVKNERRSLRMVAKLHQFKNCLCTTPPASNTSIRTVPPGARFTLHRHNRILK